MTPQPAILAPVPPLGHVVVFALKPGSDARAKLALLAPRSRSLSGRESPAFAPFRA
jgi:hypothetical protein